MGVTVWICAGGWHTWSVKDVLASSIGLHWEYQDAYVEIRKKEMKEDMEKIKSIYFWYNCLMCNCMCCKIINTNLYSPPIRTGWVFFLLLEQRFTTQEEEMLSTNWEGGILKIHRRGKPLPIFFLTLPLLKQIPKRVQ